MAYLSRVGSIKKEIKGFNKYILKFRGEEVWYFTSENSAFRLANALKESNPEKYGDKMEGSTGFEVQIVPID